MFFLNRRYQALGFFMLFAVVIVSFQNCNESFTSKKLSSSVENPFKTAQVNNFVSFFGNNYVPRVYQKGEDVEISVVVKNNTATNYVAPLYSTRATIAVGSETLELTSSGELRANGQMSFTGKIPTSQCGSPNQKMELFFTVNRIDDSGEHEVAGAYQSQNITIQCSEEMCLSATSLGEHSALVSRADRGACENVFNTHAVSLCEENVNSSFTFRLSMPSAGIIGSGTRYCINGAVSETPPAQAPRMESCRIGTSLGNIEKSVGVGDIPACQDAYNEHWKDICAVNSTLTFNYVLELPSRGRIGAGTSYCLNGQPSNLPPPTAPQTENCIVTTSIGNTSGSVNRGDVGACQNIFNQHWRTLCIGNPNSTLSYDLSLSQSGRIGSGTNYCVNGQPSSTPPPSTPPRETCSIEDTLLGGANFEVQVGDIGSCQAGFNQHWQRICDQNLNASFSYHLRLPSRGQIGSGTNYCVNGHPSVSPPAAAPICDPMTQPSPHYGVKGGRCLGSCGVIGGNAAYANPCSANGAQDVGQAYDVPYCCRR